MASDPTTIFIVTLLLLMLLGLAGPLPYRVFYIAARNVTRLDGTLSKRRLHREVKHVSSLIGELLLVLVTAASVSGLLLLVIHEYVVPLPMVAGMLSQFDLDPVQWEFNIEHGELGDMGAQYEIWSQSQGFSGASARFWQEFLWVQWVVLAVMGFALAYFGGRFLSHFYGTAVVAYANGVLRRRKGYERCDLNAMGVRRTRSGRSLPDISEARFVDSVTDRSRQGDR
jgi:hypothetical protein